MSDPDIKTNLAQVQERITAAARRAGRKPDQVTLVAVTKTRSAQTIQAAYEFGLRDLGENRVEEASAKIPAVEQGLPLSEPVRWHMIGHLQRRKARLAVSLFAIIHSIDTLRLAQRVDRVAGEADAVMPVLLEINLSGEAGKYGFDLSLAAGAEGKAAFFAELEGVLDLPHIQPCGLMTMAPIVPDPEQVRPIFAGLRTLRDDLARRFPKTDWRELSMGMTDDFEVAVEEGATLVRVGRAIFESR